MSERKHTHGMFCSVFGCSQGDSLTDLFKPLDMQWTSGPISHGCVCPVGAEKTCQGALCPRKPAKLPTPSASL